MQSPRPSPSSRRMLVACALALAPVAVDLWAQQAAVDPALEQTPAESRVVYGTAAGQSLLMDVYRPARGNGFAIVLVPGAGWADAHAAGVEALKRSNPQARLLAPPLLTAGYTVFVVDHRGAPQFHFPSQVDDVARAIRFIRHSSDRYRVSRTRVGIVGYSSGANLAAMLGVRPDQPDATAPDPVGRESARVQCVVGGGTPADLTQPSVPDAYRMLGDYLGVAVGEPDARSADVTKLLRSASPITYVTPDDAQMLLFNGAADKLVPASNSRLLVDALTKAGVSAKLVELEGAGHWPLTVPGTSGFLSEMVRWFDGCLGVPSTHPQF